MMAAYTTSHRIHARSGARFASTVGMRLIVSVTLAILLAGCTREDASQVPANTSVDPRSAPGDRASTMNPVMQPETELPASQPSGAAKVSQRVELNEYAIRMPQQLDQGAQKFLVVNSGKEMHSFEIEGNGVHAALPSNLQRGDSATMEVSLPPGTYTVYCPIKGHRERGMSTQIAVR